ncbi:MAG TPA: cbb3-type cytochrome c oxidase subunit I [Reyranella sp.]|jgi:nitric oxide reductase subunit B
MTSTQVSAHPPLPSWWKILAILTMLFGFAVLIGLTVEAYRQAPPIPAKVVDPAGKTVFTREDVSAGQQVFLKYGLMANGTIWGHGAYLGPDFSATYLHNWAVEAADQAAQARFRRPYAGLTLEQRGEIEGGVAQAMKRNSYDAATDTLRFSSVDADAFEHQVAYWKDYFATPSGNGGLAVRLIDDPQELRQLTAFFAWAAWASTAERPGTSHSYTNNFPYDPLAGNTLTSGAVVWSALSLVFLLGGTGIVLLAYGRFSQLGWHRPEHQSTMVALPEATSTQQAALKFMVIAAVLFLGQTLIGGGVAHYRAEPGDFYGFDLSRLFPSNLLRIWHVQLAILWIATAYVGGALFVAGMLNRDEPAGQRTAINVLFVAVVFVAVGSLLGEWAGLLQWLGAAWWWIGNQGWEYLEMGRAWQILLALGLVFWFVLLWRAVRPVLRDQQRRPLVVFFLIATAAIPVFYLPALFYDGSTHFTIVDTWRFWIIHLWVEGFFELFVTVMVGIIFYQLGLVERDTALRAIYLDVVLVFGGGLIGTGHHWYFNGQTELNMALSAAFSALEVVPLTVITLDAWQFVTVTRGQPGAPFRHKWTFYFLMAVGFWNFTGAGIFGFLINMPIVSYFEVGTNLTPNHGHAAMMGVFGMLGVGLMVFVLRETVSEPAWTRLERYIRVGFWGLNIGLAMMVVLSLFPSGVLQMRDVIENGYWHARSLAFTAGALPRLLEWLRLPGDLVFIVLGAAPIALAMGLGYLGLWTRSRVDVGRKSAAAE